MILAFKFRATIFLGMLILSEGLIAGSDRDSGQNPGRCRDSLRRFSDGYKQKNPDPPPEVRLVGPDGRDTYEGRRAASPVADELSFVVGELFLSLDVSKNGQLQLENPEVKSALFAIFNLKVYQFPKDIEARMKQTFPKSIHSQNLFSMIYGAARMAQERGQVLLAAILYGIAGDALVDKVEAVENLPRALGHSALNFLKAYDQTSSPLIQEFGPRIYERLGDLDNARIAYEMVGLKDHAQRIANIQEAAEQDARRRANEQSRSSSSQSTRSIRTAPIRDYYKVLSVSREAKPEVIKAAYRRLAKKYHPDLNQGNPDATKQFIELNHAYEVLSDPQKRRSYDLHRDQFGVVRR